MLYAFFPIRRPRPATLFPSTTLFRSLRVPDVGAVRVARLPLLHQVAAVEPVAGEFAVLRIDRKSTRLNSSHVAISYAVFCLKNKNISHPHHQNTAPRQGRVGRDPGAA